MNQVTKVSLVTILVLLFAGVSVFGVLWHQSLSALSEANAGLKDIENVLDGRLRPDGMSNNSQVANRVAVLVDSLSERTSELAEYATLNGALQRQVDQLAIALEDATVVAEFPDEATLQSWARDHFYPEIWDFDLAFWFAYDLQYSALLDGYAASVCCGDELIYITARVGSDEYIWYPPNPGSLSLLTSFDWPDMPGSRIEPSAEGE